MALVAPVAVSRLSDFALLDKTSLFLLTAITSECCLFHFRNHITATNDDSSQSYQFFNVSWVKFSDPVNLSQIERSHLNQNILLLEVIFILQVLALCERTVMSSTWLLVLTRITAHSHVEIHFFVDSSCNKIKNGNDVAREVLELSVELRVELSQVLTIYFQYIFFQFTELFQFFPIEGLAQELCIIVHIFVGVVIDLNKSIKEVLEFLLKFTGADVCTPDNLSVLTGLNVHTLSNQTC